MTAKAHESSEKSWRYPDWVSLLSFSPTHKSFLNGFSSSWTCLPISLLRDHPLADTAGQSPSLTLTSFNFHFSLELQKFRFFIKGQIGPFLLSDCYRSCNTHLTAPLLSGSVAGRPLELWDPPSYFSCCCFRWKKIELGTEVQIL